jgi:uncharacterized protein YpmS
VQKAKEVKVINWLFLILLFLAFSGVTAVFLGMFIAAGRTEEEQRELDTEQSEALKAAALQNRLTRTANSTLLNKRHEHGAD